MVSGDAWPKIQPRLHQHPELAATAKRRNLFDLDLQYFNRRNSLVKSVLDKLPRKVERNGIPVPVQHPHSQLQKPKVYFDTKRASLPELSTQRPAFQKQSEQNLDSKTIYQTLEKAEFQQKIQSRNHLMSETIPISNTKSNLNLIQNLRKKEIKQQISHQVEMQMTHQKQSISGNSQFSLFTTSPIAKHNLQNQAARTSTKLTQYQLAKNESVSALSNRSHHKMRKSLTQIRYDHSTSQFMNIIDQDESSTIVNLQNKNLKKSSADDFESSSSDSVRSGQELIPGQIKTKYSMGLKLGIDKKQLKGMLQRLKIQKSKMPKQYENFEGQVIFGTNKLKYDTDKKWQVMANPKLNETFRIIEEKEFQAIQRRHNLETINQTNLYTKYKIPSPKRNSIQRTWESKKVDLI